MDGVPKFESMSRGTLPTAFAFLYVPLVMNLRAKFEVFSSNRSRDMNGVVKFLK